MTCNVLVWLLFTHILSCFACYGAVVLLVLRQGESETGPGGLHLPLPGGAACGPLPSPPFVAGTSFPGVRIPPGSWDNPGRRVRPAAGGSAWRGVALPRSVPLPSLGGQQSGRHWRRSGHGGRRPYTAPVRCRVPPTGMVRVPSLCAGAGSPACCGPRGSRRWGRGGARCAGSAASPPGRRGPYGGRGGVPSALGGVEGRRPRGLQARGGIGGERGGGARRGSPPPRPAGVACGPRPSPPSAPAHPPWVYAFSRGCWAAPGAGRGLVGRRWVSLPGGGGGGCQCALPPGARPGGSAGWGRGGFFAAVSSPAPPGLAPRRVASSASCPPCCIPGCCNCAAAHGGPINFISPAHSGIPTQKSTNDPI